MQTTFTGKVDGVVLKYVWSHAHPLNLQTFFAMISLYRLPYNEPMCNGKQCPVTATLHTIDVTGRDGKLKANCNTDGLYVVNVQRKSISRNKSIDSTDIKCIGLGYIMQPHGVPVEILLQDDQSILVSVTLPRCKEMCWDELNSKLPRVREFIEIVVSTLLQHICAHHFNKSYEHAKLQHISVSASGKVHNVTCFKKLSINKNIVVDRQRSSEDSKCIVFKRRGCKKASVTLQLDFESGINFATISLHTNGCYSISDASSMEHLQAAFEVLFRLKNGGKQQNAVNYPELANCTPLLKLQKTLL